MASAGMHLIAAVYPPLLYEYSLIRLLRRLYFTLYKVAFIADGLKRNFPFIKRRINVIVVISIRCTRVRAASARWENRVIGSARVIAIWNYYDLQLADDRLPFSSAAYIVVGCDFSGNVARTYARATHVKSMSRNYLLDDIRVQIYIFHSVPLFYRIPLSRGQFDAQLADVSIKIARNGDRYARLVRFLFYASVEFITSSKVNCGRLSRATNRPPFHRL